MAIDDKALGVLFFETERQQKVIAGMLEGLEVQIAALKVAATQTSDAATLGSQAATAVGQASHRVEQAAHEGAKGAVAPAINNALAGVAGAVNAALVESVNLTKSRLYTAAGTYEKAAAHADQELRRAARWFGTKAMLLVATSVMVGWLFGWGGVLWEAHQHRQLVEQNEALKADIDSMKIEVGQLEAKGGRIKLLPGGCGGRLCIEVSSNQQAGNEGWKPGWKSAKGVGLVIPNGY